MEKIVILLIFIFKIIQTILKPIPIRSRKSYQIQWICTRSEPDKNVPDLRNYFGSGTRGLNTPKDGIYGQMSFFSSGSEYPIKTESLLLQEKGKRNVPKFLIAMNVLIFLPKFS